MSERIDDGDLQAVSSLIARQGRRLVELPGFGILVSGQTVDLTVLDLSYDGCCVETPIELSPGQAIKLSVMRRGKIDAQVRWCRDGKAGLAFTPRSAGDEEPHPRAVDRIVADAEVILRRQGHRKHRVRLFDISREGCKTQFVERPSTGSHVWIKFEGLEALDAEVCWVEGFQAGLRYVNPIHPAVFDLLTKRLSVAR